MRLRTLLRHLGREASSGRGKTFFFVLCLAVGVAAVVAVAGFGEGLDRGIRGEARQLLAADLAVRGRQPAPAAVVARLQAVPGAELTRVAEMLTVVAAGEDPDAAPGTAPPPSLLVEVKAVDGTYPFYGRLALEPDVALDALLAADAAVVAPELLGRLGVAVGDTLRIGGESFRITGVVGDEPDRVGAAFRLGPRLFLSGAGLERAGLEQLGSRVLYRTLVRLPPAATGEVDALAAELRSLLLAAREAGRWDVETFSEAQPELRQGLRQVDRYLGLAALLSLVIGGVGVAQTVRAWLARRMDAIAIYKCLGYRPRDILALYLGMAVVLGLVGSLLGILLGLGLQQVTAKILAGVLPVEYLRLWQPLALLRGVALGVGTAVVFALPPILAARRVPPVRVLRAGAEPLPPSRTVVVATGAALLLAVTAVAWWQSRSLLLGAAFAGGLAVAAAALAAAAVGLLRLAARPRTGARSWLRQGLAALARPGAASVGGVVALGLGVLVVLGMRLTERHLSGQLERDLPASAPSVFFVDIQPHQWQGMHDLLRRQGATHVDSVPVVMARIVSLGGRTVQELAAERDAQRGGEADDDERGDDDGGGDDDSGDDDGGPDRWALEREQRLTYLEELPDDNEIIAGALWSRPGVDEVSVEKDFADDLGVTVGSEIVFDIQGVRLPLTVTSLRTVEWDSFGINFFLVVEPGVLDDAPQNRIAAARLPAGSEQTTQDALAAAYPNVTMIRIRAVLEKITAILRRLGLGVRLLGLLTVLAGLVILAGAVSAAASRRGREVALLKTLGMTRGQVVSRFAVEYALTGTVAALIGSAGGVALAWSVVTRGLELEWQWRPGEIALAVLVTIALAVVSGLAASLPALQRRPIEVLRGE